MAYTKEKYFEECLSDVKDKIPSDWEYIGWVGDECPSYKFSGHQIFIDHPNAEMRDAEERFAIATIEDDDTWIEDVAQFDEFADVLEFFRKETQ